MKQKRRKSSGRKTGNERLTIYLLLGVIGVLLIALLYIISGTRSGDTGRSVTDSGRSSYGSDAGGGSAGTSAGGTDSGSGNISGSSSTGSGSSDDSGGGSIQHDASSARPGDKGHIYFVIDDVGNNIRQLQPFLNFPGKITFAVMPRRRYSAEAVNEIQAAGKEYIIHQPMEALNEASNPGAGAIFSGMDKKTVYDIMAENMASVPGARGMNNHEGSRLTSDPDTLAYVFDFLKDNNMFFLDSITMPADKIHISADLAKKYSLKYAKRNAMFLDNDKDRSSIMRMIEEGKKVAGKKVTQ